MVAKDIVCMFASNSSIGSNRGVTKVLGVDKRNIRKALERQIQMDIVNNAFWITQNRSRCCNILPTSIKNLVIQLWTSQTTISPNWKDVVRWHISIKVHEEHAAHYLKASQVRF